MKNFFYFLSFLLCFNILNAQNKYWNDVKNESDIKYVGKREIVPQKYQLIRIDFESLKQYLNTAPKGTAADAPYSNFIFSLPMADGSSQNFRLVETPLLSPDFAALRPDIKTFTGYGVDDRTATLVMDYTPDGFHAMVLSPINGTIFIDPYSYKETNYYVVYNKKDYKPSQEKINQTKACGYKETDKDHKHDKKNDTPREKDGANGNISFRPSGSQLRTYRLAVAATGEYTQARGNSVVSAQNSITSTINRVSAVFQNEVASKFELVINTSIIYTNGATDPYTNDDGFALLVENQTNIDNLIGNANYDIGHVFSTGGGGVAGLGSLCLAGAKARGVTGSPNPTGDPFDIDYVAHEIGHQFGGQHTFNTVTGPVGYCNGNRSAAAAYEPGSGSTIMAYAGICGASNNLQNNTDNNPPYFHTKSYDQMLDVIAARNCGTVAAQVNSIPTINLNRLSGMDIPASGFKIPASTPFFLGADAADADAGDVLTYCWEQFDLGAASEPTPPGTLTTPQTGPIFRSFVPTTNSVRTFPRLSDLRNNTTVRGEALPSTARNMTFRVTVRDNKPISGVRYGAFLVGVIDTGTPFSVTAPNTSVNWQGCSTQTVTWNVAGTTANGINCANVKIMLSTDGGLTYPTTILASTPNDGSHDITVPNINTSQARIRVESVGNFFFDISNVNFTITPVAVPNFTMSLPNGNSISACPNSTATVIVNTASITNCNGPVNFSVTGLPSGVTAIFDSPSVTTNGNTTLTFNIAAGVPLQSYNLQIIGTGSNVVSLPFTLTVAASGVPFNVSLSTNTGGGCVGNFVDVLITISNLNACNGPINLNVSGIPANVAGNLSQLQFSSPGTSSFRITINSGAVLGTYNLNINAVGPGGTVTQPFALTIRNTNCNTPPTATNSGLNSYPQDIPSYVIEDVLIQPNDAEDLAAYNFSYKIKSLPANGTLQVNGITLSVGQNVLRSDIKNALFVYSPTNKNTELDDVFGFTVVDSQNAESPTYNFPISLKNINTPKEEDVMLYPNPTSDANGYGEKVFIKLKDKISTTKINLKIYDEKGSLVRDAGVLKPTQNFIFEVDLKSINTGIYILKIETGNATFLKRLFKRN